MHFSRALTGAVFGAAAMGVAAAASADELRLTAVSGLQQTNPLTKSFLENFVALTNKEAKGTFRIDYIGGQDVVPPTKAADAVARGQFDILHSPASYYIGKFPEAYGMLASNQPIGAIRKNGGWELLNRIHVENVKLRLLAWGESETHYNTYLVSKPKLDKDGVPDLSGTKMRATGTYRPLFRALGASTINMKSSEIYTGLERGVVQGFGWPETGVPAVGLHKLVKYRITPAYYKGVTVTSMNLDKWKSLTRAQKDTLDKLIARYEAKAPKYMDAVAAADTKLLREAGVQDLALKGEAARKYLAIAHGEIWKQLAERSKYADKLRAKLYVE